MANGLQRCVIASSNRLNDIEPYRSFLFRNDPRQWGSVFPWEFPQHAPREVEEDFLRRFFDEDTIYMQGGAGAPDRPGNGFRFLKQVWYSCALWNLQERVPAVEAWYWADNTELLNDPQMKDFFLRADVTPTTYFKQAELDMYGDKFLNVVIIAIQHTVRQKYEKREDEQQTKDGLSVTIPAEKTLTATSDQPLIKSAPPAQHEHSRTTYPDQADFPSRRATLSSRDKPEHVPVPISTESVLAQATDAPRAAVVVPPDTDVPPYSRKRGNSTNKRSNNRAGHYPTRQPHHFADRDRAAQTFSPPFYNPHAAPGHPHGPPGPSMEYMRNMSQVQPPMQMPNHLQYVPGQFGQPGMMQPHGMQQHNAFPSHQQPVYFNHNIFPHPDTNRFTDRDFAGGFRSFSNDDGNMGRGGHRRTSQGQFSRGGKSRGADSLRGRGRGRDSFTSSDGHPAFPPGMGHGPRYSNDHCGAPFNPNYKGRRPSVFQEKNWRSNTDHPQERTVEPFMKENFDPGRSFQGADHKFAPIGPPQHQGQFNPPYQPQPDMMRSFQLERTDSATPNSGPRFEPAAPADAIVYQPDDLTCERDRIGAGCTGVKKLVVFNVPSSIPIEELRDQFLSWAPVGRVTRNKPITNPHNLYAVEHPMVWVNFANHEMARRFLQVKPGTFLGEKPTRIEVPKEYWDRSWWRYVGPVENASSVGGAWESPAKDAQVFPAPTVLRRTEEGVSTPTATGETGTNAQVNRSADTTPTPSGANTPKKKNKSKRKEKKQPEDLRKTSLMVAADLKQSADRGDEKSDTASTKATTTPEQDGKVDQPAPTSIVYDPGSREMQNQRSDSVQTEVQSAQDPPFAPTEGVQTRLPQVGDTTTNSTAESAAVVETPSTGEVIVQSEPQPESFRASREDEAKEDQTQAKNVEDDADNKLAKGTKSPAAATETPSKADEDHVGGSFHTASGSPDTIRHDIAPNYRGTEVTFSSMAQQQASEKPAVAPPPAHTAEPASPTLTDETISPKTVKRVPIPDLSAKPKVTISTAEPNIKPGESPTEQRSTSGSTIVPPTPAFITAPNTPAVGHELSAEERSTDVKASALASAEMKVEKSEKSEKADKMMIEKAEKDKAEKAEKVKIEQTDKDKAEKAEKDKVEKAEKDKAEKAEKEKIEKSKGPAQTQSFSLYGKKNEKKDKKGKKGTLKGKPASRVASESSSLPVSRATTPSIDTAGEGQKSRRGSKQGGEETERPGSKTPIRESEQKAAAAVQASTNSGKDEASTTQQESPSKRGKLSNLFSGIFGGGQQSQPSSSKSRTNSTPSSKNWLTKSKAPDRPPSIERFETQLNDHRTSGGSDIDRAEHLAASEETKSTTTATFANASTPTQVNDSFTIDLPAGNVMEHTSKSTLGLGISNTTEEQSVQGGTGPKKKAKTKKRKSDSTEDKLQINTEFSPEVGRKNGSDIFRFGDGSSPQVKHQADDRSDASSQTMGADTPSSDVASPQSARKLPLRPPGSGHLMEAKEPSWKQSKRRALGRAILEAIADPVADEVSRTATGSSDGSEHDSQTDGTGNAITQPTNPVPSRTTLFVYVGAPLRDDVTDGDEILQVEQSTEKLQRLAGEELRRRHRNGTSMSIVDGMISDMLM